MHFFEFRYLFLQIDLLRPLRYKINQNTDESTQYEYLIINYITIICIVYHRTSYPIIIIFPQYCMIDRYQTLGITRKRYQLYLKSKGKNIVTKKRFSKTALRKAFEEDDVIKTNLLSTTTKASEMELSDLSEMPWMAEYKECLILLSEIDALQQDIRVERVKKLASINETKHLKQIQKLHDQASFKIAICEKNLKKMGYTSNCGETPEQKKLFSNVIMSLAIKIKERAKNLRQSQQKDLQLAKQLRQFDTTAFDSQNLMIKDDIQEQFDEQQFQIFERKLNQERNQQILKIVKSIHSLNSLYKQLQNIVIEQGSLLDRIDENINTAAVNVEEANEHLTKAEEYQKSPVANRVICIFSILIFMCLLILYGRS